MVNYKKNDDDKVDALLYGIEWNGNDLSISENSNNTLVTLKSDSSVYTSFQYYNPIEETNPYEGLIPKRIVFSGRTTIVFWKDGTKTVVKCSDGETFIPEVGVAEAIANKVFEGSRSKFVKTVNKAYRQPVTEEEKEQLKAEQKLKRQQEQQKNGKKTKNTTN